MQWNVASAAPPHDPADRAAEGIAEAQERANGAAEAYFEAEAEIDALELEAADLEVRRSRPRSSPCRGTERLVSGGVDGAGVIHRLNASGWTSTGELGGGTHALLATSGMLYSAAFGDDDGMAGIYRSIDRGATWELLAQDAAN